jgi:hypothetical protein
MDKSKQKKQFSKSISGIFTNFKIFLEDEGTGAER